MKILLIESYDFEGHQTGGSESFCNNIIKSFGIKVALVGITMNDSDIVGRWGKKMISGMEFDFFPVKYIKKYHNKKPLIPARLTWFLALRKYKKAIVNYGCSNVFIQSQDTLLALYSWKFNNICYRFAGLANPLSMSRYKWARFFDKIFEDLFIPKFIYVQTFLAAASKMEIEDFSRKVNKYGFTINISQFPTRVNTEIFYPMKRKKELRTKLLYDNNSIIIVTSGRLSEVKGWKLLIDSFYFFLSDHPDSYLLFIGEGQDKAKIEKYSLSLNIHEKVQLIGFQTKECLAEFLNVADLFVMGSLFEGWPTSMVEALACGIPICSSNFGSAKEIIISEKIGIIVNERNPETFSLQMKKAINIKYDEKIYSMEVAKYSSDNLKDELLKYWHLL